MYLASINRWDFLAQKALILTLGLLWGASQAFGGRVVSAKKGQIIIEAESAKAVGDWRLVTLKGSRVMLFDPKHSHLKGSSPKHTLTYRFRTTEGATYRIALFSGRERSKFSKPDPGGDPRKIGDTRNNSCYVSIVNAKNNSVILRPIRLFTGLHVNSDKELWWGNSFDPTNGGNKSWEKCSQAKVQLAANTEYRLEIAGRCDGYILDRITIRSQAHLTQTRSHHKPRSGGQTPPLPTPTQLDLHFSRYPAMRIWSKAGVKGGIPTNMRVVKTISPGANIQKAINEVKGRGVVLLRRGTYKVSDSIRLRDKVVVRGEDRKRTRIEFRYTGSSCKALFHFSGTQYSGVENMTMEYIAPRGVKPDHKSYSNPHTSFNTSFVVIDRGAQNNWVKNITALNSGKDPITVCADHNTLTGNYIEGAFNKGGGTGYYRIRGSHNLIKGEIVKAVRHFSILNDQSSYNVVVDSYFETDINFHLGDRGNNLIEGNTVKLPPWHKWEIFATGGPPWGHLPPGNGNLIVNNYTSHTRNGRQKSGWSQHNVVYTYEGYGGPVATNLKMPRGGRFYIPAWPSADKRNQRLGSGRFSSHTMEGSSWRK